jgi:hypothetical protein
MLLFLGTPRPTTAAARAPTRRPLPQAARAAPPASTTPPRPSPAALHALAASTKTWLLRRVAKGAQVATTARRALRATMRAPAGKNDQFSLRHVVFTCLFYLYIYY